MALASYPARQGSGRVYSRCALSLAARWRAAERSGAHRYAEGAGTSSQHSKRTPACYFADGNHRTGGSSTKRSR